MEALTWSDRFVTGLPRVDQQHEELVRLINELGELNARRAEVPVKHLEALVDELARYAQTHFVDEEALMHARGVDPRFCRTHEAQHARFLRDVTQMRQDNFVGTPETSRVLLRFLLHWLAFHILGTDMQLARQIERLARGESADQAFTAEVHEVEGPTQLLLGALDDLMRVVAQRNAELTEANRTLESRVTQRTIELQATVETLRATQVKLVETEKLASVGQLASGLAHEINNPLGFISANLSTLSSHTEALLEVIDAASALEPTFPPSARTALAKSRERSDLDFVREDVGHLLTETVDGVKRVQSIVHDLKEFTHVDGGALVDLDLKSAVEATLKVLPEKHRANVTFTATFGAVPRVRCVGAQVNQSLLSLVQNAAQAVHDRPDHKGSVTIRTGVEDHLAFVEIADTGVGMTPEVLGHACEPFFTTRPPGQGTGLGLTTVYNCAQAHGGRLDTASQVGAGSTMRLLLPLQPTEGTGPQSFSNTFNTRRYEHG